MNAKLARAIEQSKLTLIRLSAPKLKQEFQVVRPPVFWHRATATIGEVLIAKGATL